jgi:hypothetical protein
VPITSKIAFLLSIGLAGAAHSYQDTLITQFGSFNGSVSFVGMDTVRMNQPSPVVFPRSVVHDIRLEQPLGRGPFGRIQEAPAIVPVSVATATVAAAPAPAPVMLSPSVIAYGKELYSRAESKQFLGRVLSWGGLVVGAVGGLTQNPFLSIGGGVALIVGIPVNGSGTSDMVDAANQLNPDVKVEMHGWGAYGASWGLMALGTGVAVSATNNMDNSSMAVGGIMILVGDVLQYVAWGQFSSSADRAQMSRKSSPYALVVGPQLYALGSGRNAPGLNLNLTF